MVEYDSKGQFVRIKCDTCQKPSPPTADLIINHGLIGMGWDCRGGSHICPDCKETPRADPDN